MKAAAAGRRGEDGMIGRWYWHRGRLLLLLSLLFGKGMVKDIAKY